MTTAANSPARETRSPLKQESGQALIEFLLVLPSVILFFVLMVRINSAVQVSIVNQKWSRAHIHFLTMNSPDYPAYKIRAEPGRGMAATKSDQFVLGVSGDLFEEEGDVVPTATVVAIKGKRGLPGMPSRGDNSNQSEPAQRDRIRIRNTVTLCTQNNFVKNGNQGAEINAQNFPNRWGEEISFCQGLLQPAGGDG